MKKVKKLTPQAQLKLWKQKYNTLAEGIRAYLYALENRKTQPAAYYKKSETPVEMNSKLLSGVPQQFNVIEVRTLIDTAITAQQLGFATVLRPSPDGNELHVTYVEQIKAPPCSLRYPQ
jgi:hypothetical protein